MNGEAFGGEEPKGGVGVGSELDGSVPTAQAHGFDGAVTMASTSEPTTIAPTTRTIRTTTLSDERRPTLTTSKPTTA